MGRPLRLKGDNITYHIVSRTNGKRLFMKKKSDHRALCQYLAKSLLKYGIICYAFTPMGNHFHMIIRINDNGADLSKFMGEFKSGYAKYFNYKYNTSGHFWGERFKSTIIEDDRYMLSCLRYIDRNPVRAGLVSSPSQWNYSSYHCYARGVKHPIIPISLHPTYLNLSIDPQIRYTKYSELISSTNNSSDSLHGKLHKQSYLATPEFIHSLKLN